MGIFRDITKTLKKAAPLIGASIGMYFGGPMGSAALGGALGGGIGSLVVMLPLEETLQRLGKQHLMQAT